MRQCPRHPPSYYFIGHMHFELPRPPNASLSHHTHSSCCAPHPTLPHIQGSDTPHPPTRPTHPTQPLVIYNQPNHPPRPLPTLSCPRSACACRAPSSAVPSRACSDSFSDRATAAALFSACKRGQNGWGLVDGWMGGWVVGLAPPSPTEPRRQRSSWPAQKKHVQECLLMSSCVGGQVNQSVSLFFFSDRTTTSCARTGRVVRASLQSSPQALPLSPLLGGSGAPLIPAHSNIFYWPVRNPFAGSWTCRSIPRPASPIVHVPPIHAAETPTPPHPPHSAPTLTAHTTPSLPAAHSHW